MIDELRKMKIGNKLYEVTSLENYVANKDNFTPGFTAIHDEVNHIVLPVVGQFDKEVGICITQGSGIAYSRTDDISDMSEYSDKNIIDFKDTKSMKDVIEKQDAVRLLEREILTSPDNIFTPIIQPDDSPEMVALKTAVINKHIDLDKYEPRFGSNYNNDKRLFNKPTISLAMMKRLCNALDIKSTLILEDKNSDVPNPMGEPISIEITGGDEEDEQL